MQSRLSILILSGCDEAERNEILSIAPNANVWAESDKEVSSKHLAEAEVIMGKPTHDQLQDAQKLRWLHLPSAGADGFTDQSLYHNKDIIVTTSSGVYGMPIAEHVFALILSFGRSLPAHFRNQNAKHWHSEAPKRDFFGSTLGIVGLGDIGHEVAKRGHAFGAKVLAVKRNPTNIPGYIERLYGEEGIDEVVAHSDYLVLALPHTTRTENMLNRKRIAMMKSSSYLVNIGRGALVDQEALIEALQEKRIAGAGLDVTSPEPLPQESPLWKLDNVILTSHSSGRSLSNRRRTQQIFCANLKRYQNKQSLKNAIDFLAGY